jgi:L-aminopeptidase/D-esterase-like protein
VDGDTIFVLSTGEKEVNADALGAMAAQVMAMAVNRAARMAEPAFGLKAASDFK